jgi:hypothetical protein
LGKVGIEHRLVAWSLASRDSRAGRLFSAAWRGSDQERFRYRHNGVREKDRRRSAPREFSAVNELQTKKRALADAILSADGGLMRGLTREDLVQLLS